MRAVAACRSLLLALGIWLIASAVGLGQSPSTEEFDRFAGNVETTLESNAVGEQELERLREELSEWRDEFLRAQGSESVRLEALKAQIDALGPAPAEGESEPEAVAERRAELTSALEEARAPQLEAEEAYARADALIGRIDQTLRERQTDVFFELQKTPLDPDIWDDATHQALRVARDIGDEVRENIAEARAGNDLGQRLPLAGLLLILAAILVLRGPALVERLIARIENRYGGNGRVVYGFLVSLGAIAAPVLAISLINAALISTQLLGETGRALAIGINAAILVYAIARWLGNRLFPEREFIPSPLELEDEDRRSGRFHSRFLGIALGLIVLVRVVDETENLPDEPLSVILFPLFLLLGYLLFRLGRLVSAGTRDTEETEGRRSSVNNILSLLGRATQIIAIVGPFVAAIGYMNMASGLLAPTALSLALIAFLSTLHYVVRSAYALARGLSSEESDQALMPVLVTFSLALVSLPVFALIWGMRPAEIGELWSHFKAGFRIGDTTISPGDFLTFALIFALFFVLTRFVQATFRSSVLPRTKLDKGGQNAIVSGLGYLGITVALFAGITAAGIDLSNLALVVGALGVGIGFGLQNIVNNFVSGIILLIERPISEGDWIEVNGQMGYVKSISVRSTRIETFDRTDVIVPNGDFISGTVTNWTRGNSIGRVIVPVGVAYGTDTRKVEQILKEVAEAHPIVSVTPEPTILFMGFGADSLDFEIRAILTDVNYLLSVKSDMNHEIARRFAEEGIEIPFAQRDLWLRNPEALRPFNEEQGEKRPPSPPPDRSLATPDPDGD